MHMDATFWLATTLLCLAFQGFYSMQEMAIVSLNKVRLHYYVSKKKKRAQWIYFLLQNPARLFGTTLLGVNICLQIGSECARQLYQSIGLDPDFSPITQVFIVLIFAELAPMFAARRYAESASMWGIPWLFLSSKLFIPFIYCISLLSKLLNRLFGKKQTEKTFFMEREELKNLVSWQAQFGLSSQTQDEFNIILGNIFSLKEKRAEDFMHPNNHLRMVPSQITIKQVRKILRGRYYPFLPIFHKSRNNVISIVHPRDLIKAQEHQLAKDFAKPPWFVTADTSILQILKQFRYNNQRVALVLSEKGALVGTLTLKQILREVFGKTPYVAKKISAQRQLMIEKTFPGNLLISEFNQDYQAQLPEKEAQTLSQLITHELGHVPEKGECVRIDQFEFRILETSLRGAKAISIRTLL